MESIREQEATTLSSEIYIKGEPVLTEPYHQPCEEIEQIDIKEENVVLTEPYHQPCEEIEQIDIKEENVKWEIPEDHDVCDPLQLKKEDDDSEEETTSLPDGIYIKTEPELQIEEESTSCCSEPESIILADVEEDEKEQLPTGTRNTMAFNTNNEASCECNSGISHLECSCNISKETFANLHDNKEETRGDSHVTLHSCSVCLKTFKKKYKLENHIRRHAGERPYNCDMCHKAFKTNFELKVHSRVHTGERPFSCHMCRKTFVTSSQMKVHLRVHSGERPYSCNVCQKTFKSSLGANKHSRLHMV